MVEEHEHLIPKDKTLGWGPVRIIGIFSHGILNGYTVIKTKKHSTALVMARDGVLHGPCLIYGIQYLLEEVSKTSFSIRVNCIVS